MTCARFSYIMYLYMTSRGHFLVNKRYFVFEVQFPSISSWFCHWRLSMIIYYMILIHNFTKRQSDYKAFIDIGTNTNFPLFHFRLAMNEHNILHLSIISYHPLPPHFRFFVHCAVPSFNGLRFFYLFFFARGALWP